MAAITPELERRLQALVEQSSRLRIRPAGAAVIDADALARKLAQWARCTGHGVLIVSVPAARAVYLDRAPGELGADVLCLRMPQGAKQDSWGDLLVRCDSAVLAELERYADRLGTRRMIGLDQ